MIQGTIDENRPLILVEIGWLLGFQEFPALVDTGFTAELKISQQQADELGLEITYAESILLGNDETVPMQGSVALISMEGVAKVVNVLVSKGEAIIGVGLLRKFGYELHMNPRMNSLSLNC